MLTHPPNNRHYQTNPLIFQLPRQKRPGSQSMDKFAVINFISSQDNADSNQKTLMHEHNTNKKIKQYFYHYLCGFKIYYA